MRSPSPTRTSTTLTWPTTTKVKRFEAFSLASVMPQKTVGDSALLRDSISTGNTWNEFTCLWFTRKWNDRYGTTVEVPRCGYVKLTVLTFLSGSSEGWDTQTAGVQADDQGLHGVHGKKSNGGRNESFHSRSLATGEGKQSEEVNFLN